MARRRPPRSISRKEWLSWTKVQRAGHAAHLERYLFGLVEAAHAYDAAGVDLSRLGIDRHPEAVSFLPPSIRILRLEQNPLRSFPEELLWLRNLEALVLHSCGLTEIPASIGDLSALRLLHVGNNRLTGLPASIGGLPRLRVLYADANDLRELPESLMGIKSLTELYLHGNKRLRIPLEITGGTRPRLFLTRGVRLRRESEWDWQPDLFGSPRERLIDAREADALLASLSRRPRGVPRAREILRFYFRTRAQPTQPLEEAKILLVGQGAVGKTSLVKRLVHAKFDPNEPMTDGINIERWGIPGKRRRKGTRLPLALNIWDFGGQEIMHATHQFFLTKRSLYLVVLDARKGENESNIQYWLKVIQSYGGDAPVLVVINKSDAHTLDLNERRLTLDYSPNVKGFYHVSCKTGKGLRFLQAAIKREVSALPHVYDEVPASYFRVKDALAEAARTKNFIDQAEYRRICSSEGVWDRKERDQLLRFLHDLGTVLNFDDPEDPYQLHDTNILNPEWVTQGVYQIINSSLLRKQGGIFEVGQLGRILGSTRKYPEDRHGFIVDMMRKFELCFAFPGSNGERLLVPELLAANELPLDARKGESLDFEYWYDVLPGGVISRFIVSMNDFLLAKPLYWRSGVVLDVGGNLVLARGDTQHGRFFISVFGEEKGRRIALSRVRDALEEIHATIPKIRVREMVPLPEEPEVVVDYGHLQKQEREGISSFMPVGAERAYSVRGLLTLVEVKRERVRREKSRLTGVRTRTRRSTRKTLTKRKSRPRAELDFEVFLSHNSSEKALVRRLATRLVKEELRVWLDEWELKPGEPWQEELEKIVKTTGAAAVLVGKDGIGPWQDIEMRACLLEFVRRGLPVIPTWTSPVFVDT